MKAPTTTLLAIAALALGAPSARAQDEKPVPYPHPVITEVLYDTPDSQLTGDANRDGTRVHVGDEFVELFNPHDEPIDLGGYTITDNRPSRLHRYTFVFPEGATLPPGGVCVVFNGFLQAYTMPPPYGDLRTVCNDPNEAFHGAYVYSAKNVDDRASLADDSDVAMLRAPDGTVVDIVFWGPLAFLPESEPLRSKRAEPKPDASYQRVGAWGLMLPHPDIDGEVMSPGRVPTEVVPRQRREPEDDRPADPAGPPIEHGP